MGIEVAAAVIGGAAIANSIMSGAAERKQADTDETVRQENNREVRLDTARQYKALADQEIDAAEDSARKSLAARRDAMKALATAKVQAGASGTFGGSIDAQIADLNTTGGRNLDTITRNYETARKNIQTNAENIEAQGRARIDNRKIMKPSWGGIFLGGAVSGASAGAQTMLAGM